MENAAKNNSSSCYLSDKVKIALTKSFQPIRENIHFPHSGFGIFTLIKKEKK
jgi:hypothetical protein